MPGPVYLSGDSVELRTIEEEDLEFLQNTINNPEVRAGLAPVLPRNRQQQKEWYDSLGEDDGISLLICVDGAPFGSIGFKPPNETWGVAEVGYFVAPEYWGEGYASQALALVCEYAFAERRLNKLYAKTLTTNPASKRVLMKNGFQQEGVLREEGFAGGDHVDLLRYGLLASEWMGE